MPIDSWLANEWLNCQMNYCFLNPGVGLMQYLMLDLLNRLFLCKCLIAGGIIDVTTISIIQYRNLMPKWPNLFEDNFFTCLKYQSS